MAVQLADEEGPKSPRPESTTARPQQPRQFRRATIRPDANEPGHFEQIKGTKLRMWVWPCQVFELSIHQNLERNTGIEAPHWFFLNVHLICMPCQTNTMM